MGLRIVDRRLTLRGDISDAERLSGLKGVTRDWLSATGQDLRGEEAFVAHFRQVKDRLKTPGSMVEMATRIRENIKERPRSDGQPHCKVDVATLLELL